MKKRINETVYISITDVQKIRDLPLEIEGRQDPILFFHHWMH